MNRTSLSVFAQLLRRDLVSMWREYPGKFFDTCLLFFTNVVIFSYFMPELGLKSDYGPFLLIGSIASFGLFEVINKVGTLIGDMEGDRTIAYTLTLPVTSVALFCYIAVFWALNSAALSILLFPVGKLLLFTRFDLSQIAYVRLILMFITTNLFFGFLSLWLASIFKGSNVLSSIYMRCINPLFMFGAYFYTWQVAFDLSPVIGYISLLNPMVYVMEGMRAAALGQGGYLPFWWSFFALWVFIIACAVHAIHLLRRRLDCL